MTGHRLLLVHLFLPDTLHFRDDLEEVSPPSEISVGQEKTEPASPTSTTTTASQTLPLHELDRRLKHSSFLKSEHNVHSTSIAAPIVTEEPEEEDNAVLSDGPDEESTQSDVHALDRFDRPDGLVPKPRSTRGSFSEQSKKISMSALINEAAQGGLSTLSQRASPSERYASLPAVQTISRSRRESPSGSQKPAIIATTPLQEPALPVAAASDHGRTAAADDAAPNPGANQAEGIKDQSVNTASNLPRASVTKRNSPYSTGAGVNLTLPSISHGQQQPTSRHEGSGAVASSGVGSGTRTPGAHAGGKAGTLTPLSIIGDLAAKQSAVQPAPSSTPGDSERHNPFVTGSITPMRGAQTPGHGSRTPAKPFVQHVKQKAPSGLNMTKVLDLQEARAARNLGQGQDSKYTHAVNVLRDNNRAGTGPSNPISARGASALATGGLIDHGRGARATSPGSFAAQIERQSRDPGPALSASDGPDVVRSQSRSRRPLNSSPQAPRQAQSGATNATQGVFWQRNARNRSQRASIGRRPSNIGSSISRNRQYSRESFEGLPQQQQDDQYLQSLDDAANLPPFDFVPNPSSNGGLVNAVNSLPRDRLRSGKVFIGYPGLSYDEWAGPAEQAFISGRYREERNSRPVWIDEETFELAYNHFAKKILWPVFHYTLPSEKELESEHDSFRRYKELNRLFADAIEREYRAGDIIWINDYHLLLLPEMLRKRLPHATIGFFCHIAFPSSELFRCLSVRREILRGMLGADLIGMQTFGFARHFRQTVTRILQMGATPKGVQLDGHGGFVTVSPFPIGIDVRSLNRRRAEADVTEWVEKLKHRYEGKKIIMGRDKLDWIKGVRQKLLAFELFLEEHQDWVGKVVLIQVALATTEENEEAAASTEVVARINKMYSTLTYQPVVFLHVQDITFSQYLALLTVADAFMATSLREGMGLTAHEWVICQETKHRPLILSEFTGSYSALRAAIGINPWAKKQVSAAIYKALTMEDDEAGQRWEDLHRQVVTQTAPHWASSFLGRLERAHIDQERRNHAFIPRLEVGQLSSEWRAAKSRLLFLDLEETLMEDDASTAHEQGFHVPTDVLKLLQQLCADAKNRVYVSSSRGTQDLEQIAARVPRIGFISESGCQVLYAGEGAQTGGKQWVGLVADCNLSWRAPVKELLSYFTERTPGSWLEDRGSSILWQFWSTKLGEASSQAAQWARRQSNEALNLIYDSLGERYSLRIIPKAHSFLIMPKNVSRQTAIQHIVSLSAVGSPLLSMSGAPLDRTATEVARSRDCTSTLCSANDVTSPISRARAPHSSMMSGNRAVQQIRTRSINEALGLNLSFARASDSDSGSGNRGDLQTRMENAAASYGSTIDGRDLHPSGRGSFDFVFAIGQDDGTFAFVNGLDLPFAPITCTCSNEEHRSSEASFFLNGIQDVKNSLWELIAFKGRDIKWGSPFMADV